MHAAPNGLRHCPRGCSSQVGYAPSGVLVGGIGHHPGDLPGRHNATLTEPTSSHANCLTAHRACARCDTPRHLRPWQVCAALRSLAPPATAQRPRSVAEWEDRCALRQCQGYPDALSGRCGRRIFDLSVHIAQDIVYRTFNAILCTYGFSE